MNKSIEIMRQTRLSLLGLIKDLTLEQLNKVPAGFNNNIIWNLGHLVAAQQGVCYKRAGQAMYISEEYFAAYRPETKPEHEVGPGEVDEIKALLFSTLDQLEADYESFNNIAYPAWTTRYGAHISCFEDAVNFLPFHEGLHFGYIMALKRLV